jgi:hypothetical protein
VNPPDALDHHASRIDPALTLNNHQGRPMYLLDDRRKIEELI